MARITVDELRLLINRKEDPLIVDLRPRLHLAGDARSIPGAHSIELGEIELQLAQLPKDREIVFFLRLPERGLRGVGRQDADRPRICAACDRFSEDRGLDRRRLRAAAACTVLGSSS
jgi:hypothetical protein